MAPVQTKSGLYMQIKNSTEKAFKRSRKAIRRRFRGKKSEFVFTANFLNENLHRPLCMFLDDIEVFVYQGSEGLVEIDNNIYRKEPESTILDCLKEYLIVNESKSETVRYLVVTCSIYDDYEYMSGRELEIDFVHVGEYVDAFKISSQQIAKILGTV